MKVTVLAEMQAFSQFMQYGGANPIIFRNKLELDVTWDMLVTIAGMYVTVDSWQGQPTNFRIIRMNPEDKVINVLGMMASGEIAYIDHLLESGWQMDEEAIRKYPDLCQRLPVTDEF